MRVFAVVVLAAVSFALSWECEQKNVRTYLEKKMINVCTNLEAGEQDELDQIYGGDYIVKRWIDAKEITTEFITDRYLIDEMIKKIPYPDSYVEEVDVERVMVAYDKKWNVISIRYQSQLYNSPAKFGNHWWKGIAFYFDKKGKVVRVHRYGQSGAFLYCTEFSKYVGKTGNWDDLNCGQVK